VALLRIPLGCLTSTILRLAMITAVLVLGYLFIVKPALDKANDEVGSGAQKTERLTTCIAHSHGNILRLHRCAVRF
jgi:hypothetical protein